MEKEKLKQNTKIGILNNKLKSWFAQYEDLLATNPNYIRIY